jgi:oxygen-dependent protoporphyrinogen oxidase
MNTQKSELIIIGGGIAGLAAAWYAQQQGIPYTLLESSNRFGGLIHTERVGDTVIEYGPDAFITRKPHALQLVKELDLEDALIPVNKTRERIYVLIGKRLVPLPDGLGLLVPTKLMPFLRSPLLTWTGKLRLLLDWFIPAKTDDDDESLADFITRRMGKQVLDRLADPLLAGVYNAEMDKQSILATFPQYRTLEKQHGSLIRGMRSSQKSASEDSGLMSFQHGMSQLVDTLVSQLTGDLRLNTRVERIMAGYQVHLASGEILESDSLIMATSANIAANLMQSIAPEAAQGLGKIRYAGIGSISLAYRVQDISHSLDAYGVVIPSNEGRPIDGIQWNSSKWSNRAPAGMVLLRVFFGGPHTRAMLEKSESEIVAIVREQLRDILGIQAEPQFYRLRTWANAYPQYDVGHVQRVADVMASLPPTIALAGNAYHGVGIPDTVKSAISAVQTISQNLTTPVATI